MLEDVVKVFISYSWDSEEHKTKVLKLSDTLRNQGIGCQIDRYHQSPPEGWYRWMMNQVDESDFVLVVCTEKYNLRYRNREAQGQGQGVTWEGGLIIAELYQGQGINNKFIPVLLSPEGEKHIPRSLQPYTVYRLFNSEDYDVEKLGDYQNLYRHLTKQPAYLPPKLGKPQTLPCLSAAFSTVGSHGEIIQTEEPAVAEERVEQEQNQLEQQRQAEEQERQHQTEQLRQQQVLEAEVIEQPELEQQQQAQLSQKAELEQQQFSIYPIGYAELEELLKVGRWKDADEQTKAIVLMGDSNSLLKAPEIRQLPLDLLDKIDRLWMEYSDARFGLRVQQQLWQKTLEPEKPRFRLFAKKVEPLTEPQAWNQFGCLVGWRSEDEKLLPDTKLDFSMKAPPGCFPRTRLWLHGGYGNTVTQFVALMERISQLDQ